MQTHRSWPGFTWICFVLLPMFAPALFVSARWQDDPLSTDPWLADRIFASILLAAICGALAVVSNRRSWPGVLSAGIFVLGAGLLFVMAPTEDAYIFFRYVENTLAGFGPVFNPGEYVEGFTSPLWFLFLLIGGALGGTELLPLISVTAGIVLLLVACTGITAAAYSIGAGRLAGLASVMTAVWFPILFWTWSGMGTALHLALLAWAITLTYRAFDAPKESRGRFLLSSTVLMTAVVLTRPESILLLGVHLFWCLIMAPQPRLRWILRYSAVPTIALGSLLVFRLAYYGQPLPNTYYCKVGTLFGLAQHGVDYLLSGLVAFLPIAIPGLLALVRRTPGRRHSAYITSLLVTQIVVVLATGADYFIEMRFFTPFWVILLPPAMLEIENGLTIFRPLDSRTIRIACAAALAVALFTTGFLHQSRGPQSVRFFGRVAVERWAVFGKWVEASTNPETVVASPVIGAIGFFSKRTVIDMLGLTDPVISRSERETDGPKGHDRSDAAYVLSRSPNIVFLDGWWRDETEFLEDQHWMPAVQDLKAFLPSPQFRFTNLQFGTVRWSVYILDKATPSRLAEPTDSAQGRKTVTYKPN